MKSTNEPDFFAPPQVDAKIILLDYVQTLVENGKDPERQQLITAGRYRDWIKMERYRPYLLDLLKNRYVILITARHAKYERATMYQISKVGNGFYPQEWYFNTRDEQPADSKRRVLRELIYPKHGLPEPGKYLALESNHTTRAMYSAEKIVAMPVSYGEPWTEIPKLTLPQG